MFGNLLFLGGVSKHLLQGGAFVWGSGNFVRFVNSLYRALFISVSFFTPYSLHTYSSNTSNTIADNVVSSPNKLAASRTTKLHGRRTRKYGKIMWRPVLKMTVTF